MRRSRSGSHSEPPEVVLQEIKYPPSGPFPIEETAIAAGPHADDRAAIAQLLRSGATADILVEFEVSEVRDDIHRRAAEEGRRFLGDDLLAEKRLAYARIKLAGLAGLVGVVVLRDYENLPSSFVRVLNEAALNALIARPQVKAVYRNKAYQLSLYESLPLIHQPEAASAGRVGYGTTVAVLDTGVEYTGWCSTSDDPKCEPASIWPWPCTAHGPGCRIADIFEADDDGELDDNGHGTHVSAIVLQTAGGTRLVVADVFTKSGPEPYGPFEWDAYEADIESGVNWVIGKQSTFNIVAMNLSLAFPIRYPEPCTAEGLATPLAEALAAGIRPIAATGNDAFAGGAYSDGISPPACVPSAVRVGAVYDADLPQFTWSNCADGSPTADMVSCFSQSAPYISLLAPGWRISAATLTYAGTSAAAPHVSGAWAIMRALSNVSEARLLATLQEMGEPVTDSRQGRTTSRVDLMPEPGQLAQCTTGVLALLGLRLRRQARPRRSPQAPCHLFGSRPT